MGRATRQTRDVEFTEFASAYGARLRRTAYLLCHDWHLAEDLAQTALAKTYVAWRRSGAPDSPHAFCQKVLMRSFLDHRRRRSTAEVASAELPEQGHVVDPNLRLSLVEALRVLPARDRAIVVLRYWEDLSVERVAELLGVTASVVKSQSARSLERLRTVLADDLPEGGAVLSAAVAGSSGGARIVRLPACTPVPRLSA